MKIRTFICIDIPPTIREKLAELQQLLRPLGSGVSWSRPEGIHLTLKFLGDVEHAQIDEIARSVRIASAGINPFMIAVSGAGAFPNFRRPRVLWIGVQDRSENLLPLQRRIEMELQKIGRPPEQRNFSPHLTLARIKFHQDSEIMMQKFQEQSFPQQSFIAAEVIVMRSELKPDGAVYTPLEIINLNE